ncbi:MAG: insulinase family protein [Demequina sp.]
MTAPEIVHEDHHGIPVLWSDIRTTYSGSLTFGIGIIDETARTAGIAHLVEHLVMSRVGDVSIAHNAETTDDRITFYAQGSAHRVKEFLHSVGASVNSLHSVTDAEVTAQHRIIAAELGEGFQRTGHGPLLERYGAATLGLLDLGSPALESLVATDVVAWAQRWLTRGNAVLTFTGPPPEDLNINLPDRGPRPAGEQVTPLPHRLHGWIAGGSAPVAITLDLTAPQRLTRFAARRVIGERFRRVLRTERQLIYAVDGHVSVVSPDTTTAVIVLDPPRHHILTAAQCALAELRSLAHEGPTAHEWNLMVEETRNAEEDSEVLSSVLVDAGVDLIRDAEPPTSLDHRLLEQITPAEIRDTIAASLDRMLLSLGDFDTDATPESLSDQFALPWARGPEGHYEAMSGPAMFKALMSSSVSSFDPKPFKGRRGQQLIVDLERITWAVPQEGLIEARWDEVVAAGHCDECGMWDVTTRSGEGMLVHPAAWRGGVKLSDVLNSRVPEHLRYQVSHAEWH